MRSMTSASSGAEPTALGLGLELLVGDPDAGCRCPQRGLVEPRPAAGPGRPRWLGGEVGRSVTHEARRAVVMSRPAWASRSISPSASRNSAVTSAASSTSTTRWRPVGGPEHGQVAAVVGGQLDVDAGAAGAEGPDELADQALALELADAGDHRQPGVEVQGEGVAPGLDHHPARTAPAPVGMAGGGVESNGPRHVAWPGSHRRGGLGLAGPVARESGWGAGGGPA